MIPLVFAALAMGALGSVHCVAMCGGILGLLTARPRITPARALVREASIDPRSVARILAFNVGRIASYAGAGVVAGGFGALVQKNPWVHGAELGLRLVIGVVAAAVGLALVGVRVRGPRGLHLGAALFRSLDPIVQRLLPVRSTAAALCGIL